MDCNQALKSITKEIETLTNVVKKHHELLTSHEKRLQRLEAWASDKDLFKNAKILPPLKDEDH
jgi:hypothetical protein